ncbi:related to PPM1-carboxyl methyltransferase [Sporisorium reilianum f. sp. reilianum]|uniref:Leucine carboxyl methyltransferase 1 n=1 Tax=Sporisorium reilianum f. sp. reilianum TaxID=72559 RepID=A0A2N8UJE2_9BASI|nr:related to PPM1-carboxyl methyltransferase [Sporisorium reilianum f. sp. reilianum]
MQRNTPLRDPFATDDEAASTSAAAVGRPPQRFPQAPPLRSVDEPFPSRPSQPVPALGAPCSSVSNDASSNSQASTTSAPPPRPLGLSLGLPRSRTAPKGGPPSNDAGGAARQADDAVRNTDSDALLSRLSALKLGYLPPEPFTQEFSTSSPSTHRHDASTRRSPLINIGTYLRCSTIDAEIETFLKQGDGQKQIISIGAGSDSRYWRFMSDADLSQRLHHYVEIDFAENTSQKLSRILRSPILRSHLDPTSTIHGVPLTELTQQSQSVDPQSNTSETQRSDVVRSSKYTLLAADVRRLHPDTPPTQRIDVDRLLFAENTHLDPALPTLVLFECVLAYIAPDRADWLVALLGRTFAQIHALSYDIALAGDSDHPAPTPSRFGKVMLQNLEMRKLSLPGAKAYPTIDAQSQRFVRAWSSASPDDGQTHVVTAGRSLFSIWSALDVEQKSRLSRLEGLDEVEEIDMLLRHYCIVHARRTTA